MTSEELITIYHNFGAVIFRGKFCRLIDIIKTKQDSACPGEWMGQIEIDGQKPWVWAAELKLPSKQS